MRTIRPIQNLIEDFKRLPTIGPKTAERWVYFLLKAPKEISLDLAEALRRLKEETVICEDCYNVAERSPCNICLDESRDQDVVCVVEEPLDVLAIEKTGKFKGKYHVLGGVINPLAGIGPEEIRIKELLGKLSNRSIREIILATNPSVEGEATAMYIKKQVQGSKVSGVQNVRITRIARGLPTGGDLEYADNVTLSRALEGRTEF